jgi:CHAT domain-containing protein
MLEAIEASKGRGVADLLTRQSAKATADNSIYGAVKRIPDFCRNYGFHYLSYFVDDEQTYAILVTRDGKLHAPKPVQLSRASIRKAASPVTPQVAETLSSLLEWLPSLLDSKTVAPGDHICIAADDDLANVPFSCLLVKNRPLAELCSISRIHNAFHLTHLLETPAKRPASYLGIIVGSKSNIASPQWKSMHASLQMPIERLAESLRGETLEGKEGSLSALMKRDLSKQVVHFSTHGIYPAKEEGKAPFEFAGLLLSDGANLPDTSSVDYQSVLTPRTLFERRLNLEGSHISMMACVSGLSREGVGGDALGMEWALIQGKAASVLSTHWNVRAPHAAAFLKLFYEHWIGKKKTRGTALSDTIADLKKTGGEAGTASSWPRFR